MHHILVTTDLSEGSEHILQRAIKLALGAKAKLHILHVIFVPHISGRDSDIHKAQAEANTYIRSLLGRYDERKTLNFSIHIENRGRVHDVIHDYARKVHADLIIMGNSRRSDGLPPAVLTTSESVIAHASQPVLIVNNPADDDYSEVFIAASEAESPYTMLLPVCKLQLPARLTVTLPRLQKVPENSFLANLRNKWRSLKHERSREQIMAILNQHDIDIGRLIIEDGEKNIVPEPSTDLLVLPEQKSNPMEPTFDSVVRRLLQTGSHDILFGQGA